MRNSLFILWAFCSGLCTAQSNNGDCVASLVLSASEPHQGYVYNAQDFLITEDNYEVDASNNYIQAKAGKVIVLKPHTAITRGSSFLARIEGCTACDLTFTYPNFFTPNEDGSHDYWRVNWFNPNDFSPVSIFDRYGKLVKVLSTVQDAWDGHFGSSNLFSSDYWFKLVYTDCQGNKKEYRSHFSLKR